MTDIHFLISGSAEEMNNNRGEPRGQADYPITMLKPWPDEWERIVIDKQVP
jgi:hypothetical protein